MASGLNKLSRAKAIFFFAVNASAATFTYSNFTVPNSLNLTTIPSGIDDRGEIVGSFEDAGGFHGFLRSSDGQTYTTVDFPGSTYTTALGVNNNGDIIGLYGVPNGQPAIYIRGADGSFVTLPSPIGRPVSVYGLGLNINGQTVGYYEDSGQFHSFLCTANGGSCVELIAPGADVTVAKAIDDRGQIVGYVSTGGHIQGFLLTSAATWTTFDESATALSTIATGIGSSGLIVGYFNDATGVHSFMRSEDGLKFTSLDDPSVGPGNSFACGINGGGEVVGYSLPGFDQYQGFLATPAMASGPVSDDFNSPSLDSSLWTFRSADGNGSYAANGAELRLSVPANSNHDAAFGGVDNSVSVVQEVGNADFTVEVKFNSIPTLQYQFEGMVVKQDSGNYLRFQFGSNGSTVSASATSVFSTTVTSMMSSDMSVRDGACSLWLRIRRSGSTWTEEWSDDGATYNTAGSFTQVLTTSSVGLFAGNYNPIPDAAPAFDAYIDSFRAHAPPPSNASDKRWAETHKSHSNRGA